MATINLKKAKRNAVRTDARKMRQKIYMSARWQRLRVAYLAEHPLCEMCLANGITREAEDVHHHISVSADPSRAYDWANLCAICKECHGREHAMRQR